MKNIRIGHIDDDPGMLQALNRLLSGRGYTVVPFSSAEDFLVEYRNSHLDCVIIDLQMPGLNGLELQDYLCSRNVSLPIVFLSGAGDIPSSVRAIKGGAVNFLTKPVNAPELFNAVRLAVIEGSRNRTTQLEVADLRARFDKLTPREFEVLRHVISGQLNKQIGADLGITEQTVKIHRMHIKEKTGLQALAELVRAAGILQIPLPDETMV